MSTSWSSFTLPASPDPIWPCIFSNSFFNSVEYHFSSWKNLIRVTYIMKETLTPEFSYWKEPVEIKSYNSPII
jgi:hypothetical protein